jgi:hypothetical protein
MICAVVHLEQIKMLHVLPALLLMLPKRLSCSCVSKRYC